MGINSRGKYVKKKLCDKGYKLYCIKINKKGEPRHPLILTKAEKNMSKPKSILHILHKLSSFLHTFLFNSHRKEIDT